ncbi:hypothetical protein Lser_V15G44376 [Lactuca serriola]
MMDIAWEHVIQVVDEKGKKAWICNFCQKVIGGGGINRVKKHLDGIKGEVVACPKDSPKVRYGGSRIVNCEKGKRKSTSNLHPFFTKGINDLSQPTIKSAMQSKEKIHDVDLVIVMWFYDAYAKKSVSLIIDSLRSQWVDIGSRIMSDGWRDVSQRHLINFLVYFLKGILFLKSVDASDIESNATNLCNMFAEIVDMVGEKNMVQMVTDNAANYKLSGTNLCERYPYITWSPYAAHCINIPLNWLRKRPVWKEIISPGATRFGTVFIALQSLYDHKEDLQAIVISNEFKKMLKVRNAVECKQIFLNEIFWKNCLITVKVMTPLLELLRLCDSDEKPAIGYVYEGMRQARRGIKELFKKKKELYRPYTNINDSRWDRMLRKSIYCAAYWLNPVFQYDHANLCKKNEVFQGVLEMVEKNFKCDDVLNITLNLGRFHDAEGTFGRSSVIVSRNLTRPDEWWKLFSGDIPVLKKFAIRILSQTTSSSGCKRNWSVFERIHMKWRNRLEHQRLNDLVFVHYNLHLQNRLKVDMRSYDPVDYVNIDKTIFWEVEEERCTCPLIMFSIN